MKLVLQDNNCKEHILESQLLKKQAKNIWSLCFQKYF